MKTSLKKNDSIKSSNDENLDDNIEKQLKQNDNITIKLDKLIYIQEPELNSIEKTTNTQKPNNIVSFSEPVFKTFYLNKTIVPKISSLTKDNSISANNIYINQLEISNINTVNQPENLNNNIILFSKKNIDWRFLDTSLSNDLTGLITNWKNTKFYTNYILNNKILIPNKKKYKIYTQKIIYMVDSYDEDN